MYERLLKLYTRGRLSAAGVRNAAKKGLITEEEAEKILASKSAE